MMALDLITAERRRQIESEDSGTRAALKQET